MATTGDYDLAIDSMGAKAELDLWVLLKREASM